MLLINNCIKTACDNLQCPVTIMGVALLFILESAINSPCPMFRLAEFIAKSSISKIISDIVKTAGFVPLD